ncbi:hypothetical protein [Rhodoferax sp.]|uniref:hypothetical protein n=1 Tax=Rhodoferax sp. TaxID=50421 RepID=UPI00374DD376
MKALALSPHRQLGVDTLLLSAWHLWAFQRTVGFDLLDKSQKFCRDKTDHPQALGVFKPVEYTWVAFCSAADRLAALNSLLEQGFADWTGVRDAPAEMKAQVQANLQTASPFASFGD